MPLFTFIADFSGGTYVSQVRAKSWKDAPLAWAGRIKPGEIQGIGPGTLERLRADIARNADPVALDGLEKTWCFGEIARGKLVLVNYVETAV